MLDNIADGDGYTWEFLKRHLGHQDKLDDLLPKEKISKDIGPPANSEEMQKRSDAMDSFMEVVTDKENPLRTGKAPEQDGSEMVINEEKGRRDRRGPMQGGRSRLVWRLRIRRRG